MRERDRRAGVRGEEVRERKGEGVRERERVKRVTEMEGRGVRERKGNKWRW